MKKKYLFFIFASIIAYLTENETNSTNSVCKVNSMSKSDNLVLRCFIVSTCCGVYIHSDECQNMNLSKFNPTVTLVWGRGYSNEVHRDQRVH